MADAPLAGTSAALASAAAVDVEALLRPERVDR